MCGTHALRVDKHGDPNKGGRPDGFGELIHGTAAGYKHHGCRCDDCREARRLSELEWRRNNPEYARRASRRARTANPERDRRYKRAWAQRNPHKVVNYDPRRAAAPFDEEAVEYAAIIINDPCVYCGGESAQIDHIVPLRDGGDSHWSNLAPTCARCNGSKGAKSVLDFMLYRLAA